MRKNKFGYRLATAIFDLYPGTWQVRQIEGAENAKAFWRKTIDKYTKTKFDEVIVNDPDWNIVTRQKFISNSSKFANE